MANTQIRYNIAVIPIHIKTVAIMIKCNGMLRVLGVLLFLLSHDLIEVYCSFIVRDVCYSYGSSSS